jgi:hypothetical protein
MQLLLQIKKISRIIAERVLNPLSVKTNSMTTNTIKLITLLFIISTGFVSAQNKPWKKGILVDEFIYDSAPFPEAHSATVVETPQGLVAAFFGGTKERNPDVCIYVSRHENIQHGTLFYTKFQRAS